MWLFGQRMQCVICGDQTLGMLQYRLKDGALCGRCTGRLSPWFREELREREEPAAPRPTGLRARLRRRRNGETLTTLPYLPVTAREMRAHMKYREANQREVARFRTTRMVGLDGPGSRIYLHLDDNAGKFAIGPGRDLKRVNPDVIRLSQVTSCEVRVREDVGEVRMDNGAGGSISYTPRRYSYYYQFLVDITVDTPWFKKIRYRLNDRVVEVAGQRHSFRAFFNDAGISDIGLGLYGPGLYDQGFQAYRRLGEQIRAALTQSRGGVTPP